MTSFIVPAQTEDSLLARTVESIHSSAQALEIPYEIIVVDDASSERPGGTALPHGVRRVQTASRNAAVARNAGARAARGSVLVFVDGGTLVNPAVVRAVLTALGRGAVGGGCVIRSDRPLPVWARIVHPIGIVAGRLLKLVGGCFLFCTRDAFLRAGGFPESGSAVDEIDFILSLKRMGRFVVPGPSVVATGPRLEPLTALASVKLLTRIVTSKERPSTGRRSFEFWYEERTRPTPPPVPQRRRAVWFD